MPFGIHSEHLQLGCMISIIIIILTIIIVHPKEVGRQLCPECLGEHRAAIQAVTWTQSSKEEKGAVSGLSLPMLWCPGDGQKLPGVRRHSRYGPSHMDFDVTLLTTPTCAPHLQPEYERGAFLLPCRPTLRTVIKC